MKNITIIISFLIVFVLISGCHSEERRSLDAFEEKLMELEALCEKVENHDEEAIAEAKLLIDELTELELEIYDPKGYERLSELIEKYMDAIILTGRIDDY